LIRLQQNDSDSADIFKAHEVKQELQKSGRLDIPHEELYTTLRKVLPNSKAGPHKRAEAAVAAMDTTN